MKKIIYIILAVGILAACGTQTTPADPVGTAPPAAPPAQAGNQPAAADNQDPMQGVLRIVGPGFTAQNDTLDPVSGETRLGYHFLQAIFNDSFPNMTLDIEAVPWDGWIASLQTAAAAGGVDVLVHGATIVDAVKVLDEFLIADPEIQDALFVRGTYRRPDPENYTQLFMTAVPIGLNPYIIQFDKQIFDDFGVEHPHGDDTWETLLEKLEAVTGVNPRTGEMNWGSSIRMDMTNLWRPFLSFNMQHGTEVFTHVDSKYESQFHFNSPEVIRTFEFLERLSRTFAPGFLEMRGFEYFGTPDNNVAVYLDRMVLDNWRTNVGTGTLDRFGYAPYPRRADGQGRAFFLGDWNMAIPRNAPNPEASWEFIRWMVLDPRVADYVISTSNIPNSRIGLQALMDAGKPFAEAVMETFEGFPDYFWAASSRYYDNLFGPLESIFGAHITSLYAGHITPQEAGENIQRELEEFVAARN